MGAWGLDSQCTGYQNVKDHLSQPLTHCALHLIKNRPISKQLDSSWCKDERDTACTARVEDIAPSTPNGAI